MKRIKTWFEKFKNNRKFRCGGFSVLLTASVVVLVLLVGALADGLEKRFALQIDCSFNGAATQGAVTNAVLAQLDKDVTLYAVAPASGGDETLLSLLDRYAAASKRVTVREENLVKNPVLQTQFTDAAGQRQVTEDCLIVSCPETGRARVLTAEDFTLYSYNTETGYFDLTSYSYEKSVTEAILFVTQSDVPRIQILTGHGEKSASETETLEDTLASAVTVEWISSALNFISLYQRFAPFALGQLSLSNVLYNLLFMGVMLFLSVRVLDARRWSEA